MNYLWAGMMMIGIVYAACTGRLPDITTAAIDSSKDAVSLCITMLGVMSFWMGFMEIATRAGIMAAATKKMRPVMRRGPVWRYAGQDQFAYPRSDALRSQ